MIKVRSLSEVLRNETVSSRARAFLSPLRGARDRIIIIFLKGIASGDRETVPKREKKRTTQKRKSSFLRRGIHTLARMFLKSRLFLFVSFYCYVGLNGFS